METEVKVGHRDPIIVMSKRLPVRISTIGGVLGQAFANVYGYLQGARIRTAGPPFVIYHGVPQGDQPFEIEICAPIPASVEAPSGWQVQELPAGTFATLLHVGPYDRIGAGYAVMSAWIRAHDLSVVGPPREVYLSPPDTPPDHIQTVIEFPVEAAVVGAPR